MRGKTNKTSRFSAPLLHFGGGIALLTVLMIQPSGVQHQVLLRLEQEPLLLWAGEMACCCLSDYPLHIQLGKS